jgi:hypothetical protein
LSTRVVASCRSRLEPDRGSCRALAEKRHAASLALIPRKATGSTRGAAARRSVRRRGHSRGSTCSRPRQLPRAEATHDRPESTRYPTAPTAGSSFCIPATACLRPRGFDDRPRAGWRAAQLRALRDRVVPRRCSSTGVPSPRDDRASEPVINAKEVRGTSSPSTPSPTRRRSGVLPRRQWIRCPRGRPSTARSQARTGRGRCVSGNRIPLKRFGISSKTRSGRSAPMSTSRSTTSKRLAYPVGYPQAGSRRRDSSFRCGTHRPFPVSLPGVGAAWRRHAAPPLGSLVGAVVPALPARRLSPR